MYSSYCTMYIFPFVCEKVQLHIWLYCYGVSNSNLYLIKETRWVGFIDTPTQR